MTTIIRLEELAQMSMALAGLYFLPFDFSWWIWILLFLLPDISILAYLAGNKAGAIVYNFFHHRGIAIALAATGLLMHHDILMLAGTLIYAHSSFDRLLGYGLKFFDNFKHTHLGWMK